MAMRWAFLDQNAPPTSAFAHGRSLGELAGLRSVLIGKTMLSFVLLCAWVGIAGAVDAESPKENLIVDMSSFSCGDLLRIPLPQALVVVGWFGGFYAGLNDNPKVNVSMFVDNAEEVIALCRENESTRVMALVERKFGPFKHPEADLNKSQ